jgi:hypothetical protein
MAICTVAIPSMIALADCANPDPLTKISFIINILGQNRGREAMRPGWHEACMVEPNRVI